MRPQLDSAVAEVAGRQHGVIAHAQLLALGLGPRGIAHRLADGRLHRLHRGVYAVGHRVLTPHGRWLAAVLACAPEAALSHRSAAALWRMLPRSASRTDIVVPTQAGVAQPVLRVHRCASLHPREVTLREGIPVTTPARTLLDLARTRRAPLERAIEGAEVERIFDLTAVVDVLARHAGTSGTRRLRTAIDRHRPEPTRSELERLFLALCDDHGIPRPSVNVRVEGKEVDFLWRAHNLVVETDGHQHHGTRSAFERDRRRDAALTAAGRRVVRFTYRRVTDEPATVAAELSALLARPEAALRPGDPAVSSP